MDDGELKHIALVIHNTSLSTLDDNNDNMYDVISDHHKCNRMPKAPSLDRLHRSSTHQRHWPKRVLDNDKDEIILDLEEAREESEDKDSQSVNSEEPAKKRVKHNTTHHYTKLTQL